MKTPTTKKTHTSKNDGWYRRTLEFNARNFPKTGSTRSSENEDAHRDFDGFCPNEELRRFRLAVKDGHWAMAAVLAANLDEWMSRGGEVPAVWNGPPMQMRSEESAAFLRERFSMPGEKLRPGTKRYPGYQTLHPKKTSRKSAR